jgi:tripartite-type tricarboxylate transporter receptor subunit TctC
LTFASTGPASPSQIAFEMLERAANVQMIYVPFPGNAPTVNAVLGGHVTAGIANYADVVGHLKAGTLRALVTPSSIRVESLPDVPTAAESGHKEFEYEVWFGMLAPARTPKWFAAAMQVPEVSEKLAVQGLYPVGTCGAEFAAALARQFDDYGRIIREANIRVE